MALYAKYKQNTIQDFEISNNLFDGHSIEHLYIQVQHILINSHKICFN